MILLNSKEFDFKELPDVRGSYKKHVVMAPYTWFRVGGAAAAVFRPQDHEDLSQFLLQNSEEVPITTIGAASNILIRDGGIPGVVIKLGKNFASTNFKSNSVRIGAALPNSIAARLALKEGCSGLEFLSGIPGTIGGGLRMNAGAYGREFKDILIEAEVIDSTGNIKVLSLEEMAMSYRHCGVPKDYIFLSGLFKTGRDVPSKIQKRLDEIKTKRLKSQPITERTGGSTFKNPNGYKAWELIEAAGCRGISIGGAMVSEQHCNFLVNTGNANATDLENLGNLVQKKVRDSTGIELEWEIKLLGLREESNLISENVKL
tara:strand:+ start:313 stop:1263 length:951 start_codon:yes stop_codon:yes gene_type:complete